MIDRVFCPGWIEAEDIPRQISTEYGRRGNFCYLRKNPDASGGAYPGVELTQGRISYVDLVLDFRRKGTYDLKAALGMVTHEGDLSVSFADVTTDS